MVDDIQTRSDTVPPALPGGMTALLRLALPVVTVQVGMMTMGVVDTLMVGQVSSAALAAVALGNLYFFAFAVFGLGVISALDPIVAQAVGAGDGVAVTRALQRGLLLAAVLSVPVAGAHLLAGPILGLVRQPAEVVPLAAGYALATIPGILPFFAFTVFRQTLQAMGHLRAVVVTIVLANVANVVFNDVLIFGRFGLPALGAVGSAWASTLSRWLMAGLLLLAARRSLLPHLRPWRRDTFQAGPLGRMLRLGAPIGGQLQLEFGAFGAVALLMGWLGTEAVAGHQIAINLASLTFMVPLGLGMAAAVLVGQAVGRNDPDGARGTARAALGAGVSFMTLTALLFLGFPALLAGFYTTDAAVLVVAVALLPLAGIFQVFDGIQAVSIGILRGVGDTRGPFLINILGFWCAGIPLSLLLGFGVGLGPVGLWWGLVVGLGIVAVILLLRVRARLRGSLERVLIDAAPAQQELQAGALA